MGLPFQHDINTLIFKRIFRKKQIIHISKNREEGGLDIFKIECISRTSCLMMHNHKSEHVTRVQGRFHNKIARRVLCLSPA